MFLVGLVLAFGGLVLRWTAFVTAGHNFSHIIEDVNFFFIIIFLTWSLAIYFFEEISLCTCLPCNIMLFCWLNLLIFSARWTF